MQSREGFHLDENFVLEDIDRALGDSRVATCSLEMEPTIYRRFLELIGKDTDTDELVAYRHMAVYPVGSERIPTRHGETYSL
jgi:hypothetical protein